MEIVELPSVEKSSIKSEVKPAAGACCSVPANQSVCCTPSESSEENGGACCAQPEDGSACCNK